MVWLSRLKSSRGGTAALEFALIAVPMVSLLFGILGAGIIGMYQQVLDQAVRDVTRQIQINSPAVSSASAFVNALCNQLGVITDTTACAATISYSVNASTLSAGFAAISASAISATGTLPNSFFGGTGYGPNVNVLVQVCWPPPLRLPFITGMLAADSAGNCIYSVGATRSEPYL